MASSSSTTIPSSFAISITEKLTKTNYLLWQAQVLPAISAAQLEGFLDGSAAAPPATVAEKIDGKTVQAPNPEYARWVVQDQSVLSYLFSSLTRETLVGVATMRTSAQVWRTLEEMFSSQTRARSVNTRIALATTKKGNLTVAEYFSKMRSYADELVAAGKPLGDDEFVSYILTGLDEDYDSVYSAVVARSEGITPGELYSQLLSHELRWELRHGSSSNMQSSANAAAHGRGAFGGRTAGYPARGRGRGRGRSRGPYIANYRNNSSSNSDNTSNNQRPRCQVCMKVGHLAPNCWHRFDADYVPEQRNAAAATGPSSYGADSNWYIDTGATDHITGELDKLTMHARYTGNDQIRAANGQGHEEGASARPM